jgi:hypothetical protein
MSNVACKKQSDLEPTNESFSDFETMIKLRLCVEKTVNTSQLKKPLF